MSNLGNSLINMLNKSSQPSLSNFSNIANMLKGAKDPKSILEKMAYSNPQANAIMNMIKKGNNPRDMFYNLCKQKGVNPDDVIAITKSLKNGNNS